MSVLERCPSYKETNKGNKQRQGPTLGVRFTEVSVKRESTVVGWQLTIKTIVPLALMASESIAHEAEGPFGLEE